MPVNYSHLNSVALPTYFLFDTMNIAVHRLLAGKRTAVHVPAAAGKVFERARVLLVDGRVATARAAAHL